jgi:hypothetical protein
VAGEEVQLLMRLLSYILARDYGFAPNPFYGWCTLATCKPKIRGSAAIGDWIVGTGAKTRYDFAGRLIYAMQVGDILDFDAYWSDSRFFCKRPLLNGSLKQVYGDNIYHRERGRWRQADSHHSLENGRPNPRNISRDTSVNRLLLTRRFVYFGATAPVIPKMFRPFNRSNEDICCASQGHRVHSEALAVAFERWLVKQDKWGLQGLPLEFASHGRLQEHGAEVGGTKERK